MQYRLQHVMKCSSWKSVWTHPVIAIITILLQYHSSLEKIAMAQGIYLRRALLMQAGIIIEEAVAFLFVVGRILGSTPRWSIWLFEDPAATRDSINS
jgi:hypothetical protein